jgi:hypothetical protein
MQADLYDLSTSGFRVAERSVGRENAAQHFSPAAACGTQFLPGLAAAWKVREGST